MQAIISAIYGMREHSAAFLMWEGTPDSVHGRTAVSLENMYFHYNMLAVDWFDSVLYHYVLLFM